MFVAAVAARLLRFRIIFIHPLLAGNRPCALADAWSRADPPQRGCSRSRRRCRDGGGSARPVDCDRERGGTGYGRGYCTRGQGMVGRL